MGPFSNAMGKSPSKKSRSFKTITTENWEKDAGNLIRTANKIECKKNLVQLSFLKGKLPWLYWRGWHINKYIGKKVYSLYKIQSFVNTEGFFFYSRLENKNPFGLKTKIHGKSNFYFPPNWHTVSNIWHFLEENVSKYLKEPNGIILPC